MRDLLPPEMERFRFIEGAFRRTCLGWGYQEVRTPVLEYLHLFTATGTLTPQMLNRVYSFLDWDGWSGERVVLRPDGTIPAARLFITEMKDHPRARLFYILDVFSFEETGRESRERWQAGAELIGIPSPQGDAELVMLGRDVLKQVGLEGIEVRLAHLGLLGALVNRLGLGEEDLYHLANGGGSILEAAKEKQPDLVPALSLLFGLRGDSPAFVRNLEAALLPLLPELEAPLSDFLSLTQLLTELGCPYILDMTLSRGFEYYTGAVFHFYYRGTRVGGGGRYDNLLPLLGGQRVPASGFALYLDRMTPLVSPPPPLPRVSIIAAQSSEVWQEAFTLAEDLRRQGFMAVLGSLEPDEGLRVVVEGGGAFFLPGKGRFSSREALLAALKG